MADEKAEAPCAAEDCNVLCRGRTCSSRCRSKLWKVETGYNDPRSVRNAAWRRSRVSPARPRTRYAVVQIRGTIIEVLALESARSKRAIERLFGISGREDLAAIAERHLPAVAGLG